LSENPDQLAKVCRRLLALMSAGPPVSLPTSANNVQPVVAPPVERIGGDLGRPDGVPELPFVHVARDEDLDRLRDALMGPSARTGVTGRAFALRQNGNS
jgi:hypothetical protein